MAHAITKRVTKNQVKVIVDNYPHGQILYSHNKVTKYECIALGFLTNDGKRFYQQLMWMCRAGRPSYYKALTVLYRYLYRHQITNKSLQYLASGHKRYRNGGIAVRKQKHSRLSDAA